MKQLFSIVLGILLLLGFTHSALAQTELLQNGGFEISIDKDCPPWRHDGNFAFFFDDAFLAHSGRGLVSLAGHTDAVDRAFQTVKIPTGFNTIQLSFFMEMLRSGDATADDFAVVNIFDSSGNFIEREASYSGKDKDFYFPYKLLTVDLTKFAGQTIIVLFAGVNGDFSDTSFLIDDVSIKGLTGPTGDFQLSLSPAELAVRVGESGAFSIGLSGVTGTVGTITLTISGLPPDVQASIPAGSFPLPLNITTTSATQIGRYPFTVSGTGGGRTRTASGVLTIMPQGPMITGAAFVTAKLLRVSGSMFGSVGTRILINGRDFTSKINFSGDNTIEVKGKPKKLNILPGNNNLQIIDSQGRASNLYNFIF